MVFGASEGRYDEPGGRPSIDDQDHCGRMQVPNRRCHLLIRVCGEHPGEHGELEAEEAKELFDRLGVKLSLTMAYNPEANGLVERGYRQIVKAIVRACEGRVGN